MMGSKYFLIFLVGFEIGIVFLDGSLVLYVNEYLLNFIDLFFEIFCVF